LPFPNLEMGIYRLPTDTRKEVKKDFFCLDTQLTLHLFQTLRIHGNKAKEWWNGFNNQKDTHRTVQRNLREQVRK